MSNRLLIAGLMGALAFAGGCSESKPAAVTTVAAAAPVAPAVPARDESIIATGPLVVENQVDVMAQREGMVIKTLAEPGTHVRKGQLLASLDDRQLAAELDAARAKTRATDADLKNWEAELKVVESDLERTKKMWEAQLITKEQLDHAQYKLVSDQWNVRNLKEVHAMAAASERSLELELEKTHIKAPFDGIVARRYVRQGQKVSAGDRMFWVTAVAPLRVKFTLPDKYMGKIKPGEAVTVSCDAAPELRHAAKVIQVSPVVDPSSGTMEVLAEVTGAPADLRPGMSADIRLGSAK